MPRVLLHATHYPRPDHVEDLLAAMADLGAAADGLDGLEEIGAFRDEDGDRIVAISLWSSPEALQAGTPTLLGAVAHVPFDEWERRPRELVVLPEAVPLRPAT